MTALAAVSYPGDIERQLTAGPSAARAGVSTLHLPFSTLLAPIDRPRTSFPQPEHRYASRRILTPSPAACRLVMADALMKGGSSWARSKGLARPPSRALLKTSGLTSRRRSVGATLGCDLRSATAWRGTRISGTPRGAGSTRNVRWKRSLDRWSDREAEARPAERAPWSRRLAPPRVGRRWST